MSVAQSETGGQGSRGSILPQVLAGLFPSLAVNLVSAELHLPFMWTVILVVVSIVILVIAASGGPLARIVGLPGSVGAGEPMRLAQFSLVSLMIGGAIAALSITPLWPARMIKIPGLAGFANYELLAVSILGVMAVVSAIRLKRPTWWLVFIVSSMTGVVTVYDRFAPSYYSFDPYEIYSFDPWLTILGWAAALAVITFLVGYFRDVLGLVGYFWGFGVSPKPGGPGDKSLALACSSAAPPGGGGPDSTQPGEGRATSPLKSPAAPPPSTRAPDA